MRRCPECYEIYDGEETFCEVDGQRLLSDTALSIDDDEAILPSGAGDPPPQSSWVVGLVGVTVGILLCALIFTVYALSTSDTDTDNPAATAYSPRAQEPVQSVRPAPVRNEEPATPEDNSETAEAEASPEASPDQAATPESQTVAARLNQGPVSTGPRARDIEKSGSRVQTIILMKDGTAVEVDAAWEDKQGVWYRRGGLVSFVESQLVKAITARAEPKSSSPDDTAP